MIGDEARTADRAWQLAAARGEVRTDSALQLVRAMHELRGSWEGRDPELAAALDAGDKAYPRDRRRYPPPAEPEPEYDEATGEAFDRLHLVAVPAEKPAGRFPDALGDTEVDNAKRLIYVAAGELRFVHKWEKWLVYESGRWIRDTGDVLVTERAKGVARVLFGMASECDDPDLRRDIAKAGLKAETSRAIGAMVRLARGEPGLLVDHEQLDADPVLLNCLNGTIDLRTGDLHAHTPEDLCTIQIPVAYDRDATAPLWEACVERWQPDATVRDYIQIRAGAAATGIPTETVDVDYGSGGNGKSKFWGAIQYVLGDYAVIPHKSLLITTHHEQHATVVANLFRRRLAIASETSQAD